MTLLTPANTLPRNDLRNVALWTFNLPALTFWPFLSAFPAFALLNGAGSWAAATMQWLFLLTGFWPLMFGAFFNWFLRSDAARWQQVENRKRRGLQVGFYATAWSLAYLAASLLA